MRRGEKKKVSVQAWIYAPRARQNKVRAKGEVVARLGEIRCVSLISSCTGDRSDGRDDEMAAFAVLCGGRRTRKEARDKKERFPSTGITPKWALLT
jgi:hypothetical protein